MSWVSTKLAWYFESVFKPQGTVNYKLWHFFKKKTLESIMGRRQKNFSMNV